jgi:hypothetical protein
MEICHSSCGACTVKNNPNQCSSCASALTSLAYNPFATGITSSACTLTTNNNAQFFITINKDTTLGTGSATVPGLTSVTYNGITASASGTALSTLMYTQKVIDFSTFSTANSIVFNFNSLPAAHQKVIVRARVFTECSTASGQNTTVKMIFEDQTASPVTLPLATKV